MKRNNTGPVDLVLVTWGRPSLTFMTIKAIHKNTRRSNFRLIVIDNCSTPEMMIELLELQSEGIIDQLELNDKNRGLEPARNQGLALVKNSKYFICVDNDCLAPPRENGTDWIDRLVTLMEDNPEYAAIACRTQVMIGSGNIFDGHEDDDIVEFPHPGGSLRIMRTPAVKNAGGWREEVTGRGTEERYICGKLRDAGYKTGFATKIRTLHLFGDSETDRWGYPKDWRPEDSGHSDVYHPALESGDDPKEIERYLKL